MPADLFYFLSSLPTLRWNEKPPLTHAQFLERCEESLGKKYALLLGQLELLPNESARSTVARQWQDFEYFVRNTLAGLRKARLRVSNVLISHHESPHLSPGDSKRLEEIFAMPTPLERENALDAFRWSFLENLAANHYFDQGSLEIYSLKLKLLEKLASRELASGQAAFGSLMEAGLQKAREARREGEA